MYKNGANAAAPYGTQNIYTSAFPPPFGGWKKLWENASPYGSMAKGFAITIGANVVGDMNAFLLLCRYTVDQSVARCYWYSSNIIYLYNDPLNPGAIPSCPIFIVNSVDQSIRGASRVFQVQKESSNGNLQIMAGQGYWHTASNSEKDDNTVVLLAVLGTTVK